MSRRERMCRRMPSWSLRKMLESELARNWWTAAYLELFRREVEDEILMATSDEEFGPWACVMPRGIH